MTSVAMQPAVRDQEWDQARFLVGRAREVLAHDEASLRRLDDLDARLREPLRVALAGRVKTGKSTLLNALIGEEIAPTDTGECTRLVTWYLFGEAPAVHAVLRSGTRTPLPIHTVHGALRLDVDGIPPRLIDHLEVRWPSPLLRRMTLIDTPGLASLSAELGERSLGLLTPARGQSGIDAMLYLVRHLHAEDVAVLRDFQQASGAAEQNAAMTLCLLSRADEVGGGRIDALLSAGQVADRLRTDPDMRSLCLDVLPVAGLLGQGGRSLRQRDFAALRDLAGLGRERREDLLLSADRFINTEVPEVPHLTPQERATVLQRLGVFGVRLSTVLLRDGFNTATALSDELFRRSGLGPVTSVILDQLDRRSQALRGRSVLLALDALLAEGAANAEPVRAAIARAQSRNQHADELALLSRVRHDPPEGLTADEIAQATVVLGSRGLSAQDRLGPGAWSCESGTAGVEVAALLRTWRQRLADPESSATILDLAAQVIRSAERTLVELSEACPPRPVAEPASDSSMAPTRAQSRRASKARRGARRR
ncbi:MAG: dynamin family protein [Phycicoccus sp.]|nr:dynamin family protein [Phycicoccus sp.]